MADAKTVALTCNNCGAALDVSEDVRFLTCGHCGSRLEVKHSGDALYTKVLEKVDRVARVAAGTAAEVEVVKLERELEKIEAKLAALKDPGGMGVVFMCGGLALLGLLLFAASSHPEKQGAGMMNLLIFGVIAIILGVKQPAAMRSYQATSRELRAERDAAKQRLDEARAHALTTRA